MTAFLGWTNYAKTATFIASSEEGSLPATNVANDIGSQSVGWQTTAGTVTSITLRVTPTTSAQTWRVMGVFGTNLTAAATVKFELWNTSGPTLVYSSGNLSPIAGYQQVVAAATANKTADYMLITINDAANPDTFVNVPLVFGGPAWFPLGSVGFSSTVGRDAGVDEVVSRGGQEYPVFKWSRRRWNLTLDSMRASEVWSQGDALALYATAGSNILFAPDSASTYLQREAVFGRLKSTADVSFPYQGADRRRWSASVTERL